MRTKDIYHSGLARMRRNVYMGGEIVNRDDPHFIPGINCIDLTFDLAQDQKYDGLMTTYSHLTGEKINRFCHLHQSTEDLLKKQEMTQLYCQKTGSCIGRCMGTDAANALSVVTHEMDSALGTEYHKRFLNWFCKFQENDLVGNCAQTDVKGDRSRRPHEQVDPDLYLRIVEKKSDGIVVRGAKAHNTIAPYADEIIALPTRALTKEEGNWAVSFAIPADWEGITLLCMTKAPKARKFIKAPISEYGGADSLTVFDNVFIPWERVFMCGEWQFGARLALLFALYHRHSYTGCKPALGEVLLGMTALVAEYNGVEKSQHIRHKLAEMIAATELIYAAGIAGSVKGRASSSGTYVPNSIYCNAGRFYAGTNIYHEYETLAEIAGGLPATLPLEEDFINEKTGQFFKKYIMRNPCITSENQYRCFRMIADFIASQFSASKLISGIHGGGSPVMEKIGILANYDIEKKKDLARYLAGIEKNANSQLKEKKLP